MKMKQAADRIGKHENTVRNWARQFAEFLSPAPAKGEHRRFDDNDLRVLAFIGKLSDNGMQYEDIRNAVRRRLDEGSPFPPVLPAQTPSDGHGLITLPEMETRLALKDAEIQELQGRIEELRHQLDDYMKRTNQREERYIEQIGQLREEIGRLKAQLDSKRG
jgi:DNA-binding transcriptional MerR regulator